MTRWSLRIVRLRRWQDAVSVSACLECLVWDEVHDVFEERWSENAGIGAFEGEELIKGG